MAGHSATTHSPQVAALLGEAVRLGKDLVDELVRGTREQLQRQIDQTRDPLSRDATSRVVSDLLQTAPQLRVQFPQVLSRAFDGELGDNPVTTTLDAGPTSIKFDQLELMDEQEVQARISAGRGLQQALLEAETELAELNTLVSAILGFGQVRPERNPFRPEVFLQALQDSIGAMPGDPGTHGRWAQIMLPVLGKALKTVYGALLDLLRQQRVQPVRYAISQPVQRGVAAGPGVQPLSAAPSALTHAPLARQALQGDLTVQQLHGLMAGSAVDADHLVQEVVDLVVAGIAGDDRMLGPVRRYIRALSPVLRQLARKDLHFFSDKQHPARILLEEIAQHSFGFDSEESTGFAPFMARLHETFDRLNSPEVASSAFEAELLELRGHWAQETQRQAARQQAAVKALQRAEQRNTLAAEIARHVRAQPGTALVPDAVVEFACGPWAQVMARAQMEGMVGKAGQPDHVALLEDLFWSVRPDQTRQQPGQLVKIIPRLLKGLRQGLATIDYPEAQVQQFLDLLFGLHQGVVEGVAVQRASRVAAEPQPWLAPQEARESGFMDDIEPEQAGAAPAEFPATEPMDISELPASPASADETSGETPALEHLQLGTWVEVEGRDHWQRMQLAWVNDSATLFLFSAPHGANLSMTRRMFVRMLAEERLRLVAQGAVVDRAFDAVAEMAMRNSVYMDLRADDAPT